MEIKTIKEITFWIITILIVGLCVYLLIFIRTESYQCISEPLVYGVEKFDSNYGQFSCKCSSPMSNNILIVTKDGLELIDSPLYNYNT